MRQRKSTTDGFNVRYALLSLCYPVGVKLIHEALGKYLRQEVARDDILDAMALFIAASAPVETRCTFPDKPPRDEMGLPMEMVYSVRYSECS